MRVLSKNISSHIEMSVFAIEQDQVRERFLGEGRVVQKEVELFEASRGILLDVH